MKKEIPLKKGDAVRARTITATGYRAGKIAEVREGSRGTWYTVDLKSGESINTRASCIKRAKS